VGRSTRSGAPVAYIHRGAALIEQVVGAIRRPEDWHLSVTFRSYASANAEVSGNSPEPFSVSHFSDISFIHFIPCNVA
jgi:hypothetical protein